MQTDGRWTGKFFEWPCAGCGCVLSALQAPGPEAERCLGCRAETEIGVALRTIRELAQDNDRLRALVAAEQEKARRIAETLDNVLRREAELRASRGVVT